MITDLHILENTFRVIKLRRSFVDHLLGMVTTTGADRNLVGKPDEKIKLKKL
jgi:hypothetical protein